MNLMVSGLSLTLRLSFILTIRGNMMMDNSASNFPEAETSQDTKVLLWEIQFLIKALEYDSM